MRAATRRKKSCRNSAEVSEVNRAGIQEKYDDRGVGGRLLRLRAISHLEKLPTTWITSSVAIPSSKLKAGEERRSSVCHQGGTFLAR